MKSVVLAFLAIVFTSTVAHAAPPVEKPLSHYLASATANVFNRIKTIGNYTKWIAKSVPPDQMKDFKAYLKENGISASAKFPTMKANKNSVCFTGTKDCLIFSDDSVTYGDASFKVEQKPFRKVVEDACEKIGCSNKTASYSLIPKAYASRGGKVFFGAVIGSLVGAFGAKSLGVSKGKAAGVGAIMGGLGTLILTEEQTHGCGGSCQVAWQPEQCRYQITPPQPVAPIYGQQPAPVEMYGQQQPPYYMPPQVYHQTYGQQHPPCNTNNAQPTDLQLALNTPQAPVYCNNTCGQLPPYQPPMYGQPADVTTLPDAPVRTYQSEDE